MKKSQRRSAVLIILIMLITLLGCPIENSGSSDGDSTAPFTLREIVPHDSAAGFEVTGNIILYFTGNTDEATKGTVEIDSMSFSEGSGGNCTIIFSGGSPDTVILDPDNNFISGVTYTGIKVYGFKDADGNTMPIYEDPTYSFSTASP